MQIKLLVLSLVAFLLMTSFQPAEGQPHRYSRYPYGYYRGGYGDDMGDTTGISSRLSDHLGSRFFHPILNSDLDHYQRFHFINGRRHHFFFNW